LDFSLLYRKSTEKTIAFDDSFGIIIVSKKKGVVSHDGTGNHAAGENVPG
jgi:ribosomal protein S8